MPNFSNRRFANLLLVLTMFLVSFGCEENAAPPSERIRAIKTITVNERASSMNRNFPGFVEAVDKSSLSFEVAGNVKELRVKVGDTVKKDQVIATLDRRPFELNVKAAEAEVKRVHADLNNKQKHLQRLEGISKADAGAVSMRQLDQARASYESVQSTLSYSKTQLNLAIRDLEKTSLFAPFDGVIAERHVEPFQEVKRGQAIYDIFVEGAMQVVIEISEIIIEKIHLGLPAQIRFPKSPDRVYDGIVSEISSAASPANTFPVKVALKDKEDKIRPGMSAEVNLALPSDAEETGVLVPFHALVPGDKENESCIFVFDPKTSTVRKTQVETQGSVDNNIIVTKGVKPGDIVAVAGVSYLRDDQKVKLMK